MIFEPQEAVRPKVRHKPNKTKPMDHIVKILELRQVTHDVKQFRLEKPKDYFGGFFHGRIDKTFVKDQTTDFRQPFYVCGTDEMVQDLSATLAGLGATLESLVVEK
jgi:ferredoxin-NADP reductase